jgi:hypothetical protein
MEHFENFDLEELSSVLSSKVTLGSNFVTGKIEAFTSKSSPFRRNSKSSKKKDLNSEENFLSSGLPPLPPVIEGSYLSGNFLKIEKCITEDAPVTVSSPRSPSVKPVEASFLESKRIRSSSYGSSSSSRRSSSISRRRTSSLGDLSEPNSRALFMSIIYALNETFPDYDFNHIKIDQFKDDQVSNVIKVVNSYLAEITLKFPNFLEKLWTVIDEIINLKYTEIFLYQPELEDDDDYTSLWSFHFFFFNKDIHRLIYLTCSAKR